MFREENGRKNGKSGQSETRSTYFPTGYQFSLVSYVGRAWILPCLVELKLKLKLTTFSAALVYLVL
jgi:hypothetical protein